MLQCSVVPKQIYMLTDLDLLCAHFGDFKEVAEYNPAVSEAVGRFFPVLWDGSTSWLAIDVLAERDEPIVAIEFESDRPSRRAYDSFRELLVDLVRANRENDDLQYFFPQGA